MNKLRQRFAALLDPSPDHALVSWIFLRFLALIYLAAFASAAVQITGLAGENGIAPLADYLPGAARHYGASALLHIPTLFWINHSDLALQLACYAGCFFALTLLLDRRPTLSLAMLYILYLSVFHAGQRFFNFQWDYLLLEAGFLAIFLSRGINPLLLFLFHWLLFRLRFLSGVSKLSSGDPSWSGLSALNHYFETQPLPHIGAWYAHHLPEWLLRLGTGSTLFIELVVPFFIFLPRPFRLFAAAATILIQLLIIASSNHNFINLLTIALCLFLLDDRFLRRWLPDRVLAFRKPPAGTRTPRLLPFAAIVLLATSLATALEVFVSRGSFTGWYEPFDRVRAWGIGNVYHVFPTMQTARHELVIEGSRDGVNWLTYRFRHKPDTASDMPGFIVPHQPRLDWMIWFVPTRNPAMQHWFESFLWGLRRNSPAVTGLLADNPFGDGAPPRYLRVWVDEFRFSSPAERARSGAYWQVRRLGPFGQVPPRSP